MIIASKYLKTMDEILIMHTNEVTIVPTAESWTLKTIDDAKVSVAEIKISKDLFTDYEQWDEFTISAVDLRDALKNVGAETELKKISGKIAIISDRLTQRIPLLEKYAPTLKMPSLTNTSANVLVDTAPLMRLLKAANGKMSYCRFEANSEGLKFLAKSEKDEMEIFIPADECISIEGEAKSSYPLEYMQRFISAIPKGDIPELRFSDDFPLTIEFGDKNFSVTWVVAPRIEYD